MWEGRGRRLGLAGGVERDGANGRVPTDPSAQAALSVSVISPGWGSSSVEQRARDRPGRKRGGGGR